jgi:hypothetical protein
VAALFLPGTVHCGDPEGAPGGGDENLEAGVEAGSDAKSEEAATCPGPCAVPDTLAHDDTSATTVQGGPLHPDGFIGDPTVVFEDGRYRMWFTSSRQDPSCSGVWYECLVQGFAYAESADGETWDDTWLAPEDATERTKLVFQPDPDGWDRAGMETASVLRGHDGQLRMYYTGHMGAPQPDLPFWDAIGMATSSDGITWTRHGDGPVFAAEDKWERVCCDATCDCAWGGVLEPSVLYDPDAGRYHLWYAGFGESDGVASFRIGHAVSSDGTAWQRDGAPVVELGAADGWDGYWVSHVEVVADPCGGFHMFYQGGGSWSEAACEGEPGCAGFTPGAIGYAWSSDGAVWQKHAAPLLEPLPGAWDGFFLGGPDALFRDDELELFYFGNRDLANANLFNSEIGHVRTVCRRP